MGATGMTTTGYYYDGSFFATVGVRAVSLGTDMGLTTRATAALGVSLNRKPTSSRGFTLAGTTGGTTNSFLMVALSSFCDAAGFAPATRGDYYSMVGTTVSDKGVLILTMTMDMCGTHILFIGTGMRAAELGISTPP